MLGKFFPSITFQQYVQQNFPNIFQEIKDYAEAGEADAAWHFSNFLLRFFMALTFLFVKL